MSPAYFFDHMTISECAAYLRGMHRREQDEWERTRMLMYAVCQCNSTEELEPTDILTFPWDNKADDIVINEEEIDAARERAKKLEKLLNNE